MFSYKWILSLVVLSLSVNAFAAEKGKDHPLLARFPDSTIRDSIVADFTSVTFLVLDAQGKPIALTKEGKYTGILYNLKQQTSVSAIIRNAQESLQKAGFNTLQKSIKNGDLIRASSLSGMNQNRVGRDAIDVRFESDYMLFSRQSSTGTQYIGIVVGGMGDDKFEINYLILEESQQTFVPLEVSSADVSNGLKENGKIELYGIYFDTGKAILKPESKPTLDKINQVLKADTSLKIYIVGHTDDAGNFANNMQLSQDRAKAVMAALVKDYGIDAARLSAQGVASLSPLVSNSSEFGKAKNRRVELVQRLR